MRHSPVWSLVFGLLLILPWLAQDSHRRPEVTPPSDPNVFDKMEKQAQGSTSQDTKAGREQHRAAAAQLRRELPRLIEAAQQMEREAAAPDFEERLPANLSRQGEELERLAKQVRKQIRLLQQSL